METLQWKFAEARKKPVQKARKKRDKNNDGKKGLPNSREENSMTDVQTQGVQGNGIYSIDGETEIQRAVRDVLANDEEIHNALREQVLGSPKERITRAATEGAVFGAGILAVYGLFFGGRTLLNKLRKPVDAGAAPAAVKPIK